MLEIRTDRTWRLALCATAAAAAAGCAAPSETQVVTGHLTSGDAIAVRAIDGDVVVTAAPVRADGSFALALPSGARYRLEVLTANGVKHVLAAGDHALGALTFDVCQPTAPWDIGGLSRPAADGTIRDPATGPGNGPPPTCRADDGSDCSAPPTCDPSTGDDCTAPPGCDPSTGDDCTAPPTCDPSTGDDCGGNPGPGCDPATDPSCGCPAGDPTCNVCADGTVGADCAPPAPPACDDPTAPDGCADPCTNDPSGCGCNASDPGCWGVPTAPVCDAAGACSPNDALTPERPPLDFGCGKST